MSITYEKCVSSLSSGFSCLLESFILAVCTLKKCFLFPPYQCQISLWCMFCFSRPLVFLPVLILIWILHRSFSIILSLFIRPVDTNRNDFLSNTNVCYWLSRVRDPFNNTEVACLWNENKTYSFCFTSRVMGISNIII